MDKRNSVEYMNQKAKIAESIKEVSMELSNACKHLSVLFKNLSNSVKTKAQIEEDFREKEAAKKQMEFLEKTKNIPLDTTVKEDKNKNSNAKEMKKAKITQKEKFQKEDRNQNTTIENFFGKDTQLTNPKRNLRDKKDKEESNGKERPKFTTSQMIKLKIGREREKERSNRNVKKLGIDIPQEILEQEMQGEKSKKECFFDYIKNQFKYGKKAKKEDNQKKEEGANEGSPETNEHPNENISLENKEMIFDRKHILCHATHLKILSGTLIDDETESKFLGKKRENDSH